MSAETPELSSTTTGAWELRIREALAAGPTPGEWVSDSACGLYAMNVTSADGAMHISTVLTGRPARSSERASNEIEPTLHGEGNRLLITACNSAAMTELLAELDRLRAEMAGVREDAARWRYAIADDGTGRMNWRAAYDAWEGSDSFADVIDAARTPKEPGCDLQAGTAGGGAT